MIENPLPNDNLEEELNINKTVMANNYLPTLFDSGNESVMKGSIQLCSAVNYKQKKAAGCMGPSSGPAMEAAPKAIKKS